MSYHGRCKQPPQQVCSHRLCLSCSVHLWQLDFIVTAGVSKDVIISGLGSCRLRMTIGACMQADLALQHLASAIQIYFREPAWQTRHRPAAASNSDLQPPKGQAKSIGCCSTQETHCLRQAPTSQGVQPLYVRTGESTITRHATTARCPAASTSTHSSTTGAYNELHLLQPTPAVLPLARSSQQAYALPAVRCARVLGIRNRSRQKLPTGRDCRPIYVPGLLVKVAQT